MPKISTFIFNNTDKLLLLGVPYLACTSILYYAGYWGLLGIDVYSYFAVSDLIKGAAYPIQFALATAIASAVLDFLLTYASFSLLKTKSVFWPVIAVLAAHVLAVLVIWQSGVFAYGLLRYRNPMGFFAEAIPLLHAPVYVALVLCLLGGWATTELLPRSVRVPTDEKTLKQLALIRVLKREELTFPPRSRRILLKLLVVLKRFPNTLVTAHLRHTAIAFALLMTPVFAFTAGHYQATDVLAGQRFNYVEKSVFRQDTLLAGYPYLKYLGRVGDYLFLLTPDNQRRIVIGKDHWPALLLRSTEALNSRRKSGDIIIQQPAHSSE